jgi:hypothetical protein
MTAVWSGLRVGRDELAGYVGDVRLGDLLEAGGLNETASGVVFEVGEPAAAKIFGAVGAEAGLRPDGFSVDGFGEVDDTGEFGKRTVGVDDVSTLRGTADASLGEMTVAPIVDEEIVGSGATFDVDAETGVHERFRNIATGPIDKEDGVGALQDFGGVHNASSHLQ